MMGSKRKIIDEVSPSVAVKKARTDEPVGDDSVTEPESETEPESDEDYLPEFVRLFLPIRTRSLQVVQVSTFCRVWTRGLPLRSQRANGFCRPFILKRIRA